MIRSLQSGLMRAGAAAFIVLGAATGAAMGDALTDGGFTERDPVSGYLCLDAAEPSCA